MWHLRIAGDGENIERANSTRRSWAKEWPYWDETSLRDAREGLATIGHPAAKREEPVYAATFARAVGEWIVRMAMAQGETLAYPPAKRDKGLAKDRHAPRTARRPARKSGESPRAPEGENSDVAGAGGTMNAEDKDKSRWGPLQLSTPAVLGDRVMQLHERVLWNCAQGVCTAVGNEPWIALVARTALRHITWLKRASLDLDFVVAGRVGRSASGSGHVLARTEGLNPDRCRYNAKTDSKPS